MHLGLWIDCVYKLRLRVKVEALFLIGWDLIHVERAVSEGAFVAESTGIVCRN